MCEARRTLRCGFRAPKEINILAAITQELSTLGKGH